MRIIVPMWEANDLEEMEIIKELHEEMKAKQKKKQHSHFDLEKSFSTSLAMVLKDLVPILKYCAKQKI